MRSATEAVHEPARRVCRHIAGRLTTDEEVIAVARTVRRTAREGITASAA